MKKGVDYIGVGVGAAIINREGKIFLSLRGKKVNNEKGKWETPGGGVEFGEILEEAIVREMKEEYNIDIEVIEPLGIHSHIIPDEKQYWVAPTYISKIKSGTPKILEPEKCDAIGWFTIAEAEKLPLSLVTQQDVAALKKRFPL